MLSSSQVRQLTKRSQWAELQNWWFYHSGLFIFYNGPAPLKGIQLIKNTNGSPVIALQFGYKNTTLNCVN